MRSVVLVAALVALVALVPLACEPRGPELARDAGLEAAAVASLPGPVPTSPCEPPKPATARPEPAPLPPSDDLPIAPPEPPVVAYVIRQVKTVVVDGVEEAWILRWRGRPKLDCVDARWSTCPCGGFAFGETGRLELARDRPGEPEDVLDLTKLGESEPALQHWIPSAEDAARDGGALPVAEIKTRPVFDAMPLGDYDHDGRETEFPYRIGVGGACGHTSTVKIVGISKKKPRLHAFDGARSRDGRGIGLPLRGWEEIRALKTLPGEVTVVEWPCGDHGTTHETGSIVKLDAAGFHVEYLRVACPK